MNLKINTVDWTRIEDRLIVLDEIYGSREELFRKYESFAQCEIFNDRIEPFVRAYLQTQMGRKTVLKMPIISSVNIGRKVVKAESSLYRQAPDRVISEDAGNDGDALNAVYDDGRFNVKLQKANEYFKLQNQSLIQVIPIKQKIEMRVLFPHNYDVIPDKENPEIADSYIISTFDRTRFVQSDGYNEKIADLDDFKAGLDKFTVWTKDYNFVMNGKGEIISGDDITNPIGMMPFYDIAGDKDFEYFVRQGSSLADFTVQYNAALSDLAMIVRLQGYAQAVVSGPANMLPEVLDIGPNVVLHLPHDPNSSTPTTFQFINPSPNIDGTLKHIEGLLANFLSSRGVDTNIIQATLNNGTGKAYSSGLERLLAMIDRFEASRADIDLFTDAETKVFEIVKAWLSYATNATDKNTGLPLIDPKYYVSGAIDKVQFSVVYAKPENIQTETEKVAYMEQRIAIGISDKLDALMYLDDLDETEAQEKLDQLEERAKLEPEDVAPVVQPVMDGSGNSANPVVTPPAQGGTNAQNTQPKANH